MLAYGQLAASSAGQRLARGASGNALQGMCQGEQADPRRGHRREQGGRGWADAGGGKGRLISYTRIEIPIIFITGHGDIPMTVQAMKAGAVEFLTKPFRDQDLLDAIHQVLERDRNIRQQRVRYRLAAIPRARGDRRHLPRHRACPLPEHHRHEGVSKTGTAADACWPSPPHGASISFASGRPAANAVMLVRVVSRIVPRASRVKNA